MRERGVDRPSTFESLDTNVCEHTAKPERLPYRPATGALSRSADPGTTDVVPPSLAIAGIHGYIGQLIYNAALELGVPRIYGFDPGPRPARFSYSDRLQMITCEEQFYELDADLFHIATHPEVRQGVYRLLDRGRHVNIEKPMAHPAHPDECCRLRTAARASDGSVLFDFVEVFNARTFQIRAILARLKQYSDFRITHIHCERSKDREDARNLRNRKIMVPIQYQESAHCLASLLFVLDRSSAFEKAFPRGMTIAALAAPYDPPNPEDYRYGVVDGKVAGELRVDGLAIGIHTDFKRRGAGPFKRFCIDGLAGGRDFHIEAIYDGSGERIVLDGETLAPWSTSSRHQDIVRQSWCWHCKPPALRPDADFAWLVFGLSAALWASCHEGREIRIECEDDLRRAMQCYPNALAKRDRYPALRWHEQVEHGGVVQSTPIGRDSFM
jgi:predicted dehydrogenase